jgi:hypothetical protein
MKKSNKGNSPLTSLERSKRVFIVFGAAFLSCVLLVGAVFGAIGISKSLGSVMKYKGIYLKDGVASYLASSYKYDFMSSLTRRGVECYDSPYFWESESEDGRTWGEVLEENTERYLKRVIIGSYLFDRNTRLNRNDRDVISRAVTEVLEFRAGGSISRFDELGADKGFTFRDFERAAELLYKYEMAESVIFGYDGSALESGGFSAECNEYFKSAYSHVMLLFIRTDGELITDPETGKETVSEYDETTRAKVEADIEHIRELISNAESDAYAEQMSPEAFAWYINEYKTGTVNDTEGYYFSSESSYSLEFAEDAPEVVRLALSTEVGHYAECEIDVGVCFIYKTELENNAYSRIGLSHFFEDFYVKASSYVYSASLDAYLTEVKVSDRYDRSRIVSTPYNYELAVKFG